MLIFWNKLLFDSHSTSFGDMATMVTLVRNPYPVPDVSREGNWMPDGPYLGKNISASDRRWYTRLQPHERLFAHHTLNSVRKDSRLYRPKVKFKI